MTSFTTSTRTHAVVTASQDQVWATLTDPDLVARFTPFLRTVRERGEHWVWELARVPVLGRSFTFTFTERMTFEEPHRIDFTHDPDVGHGDETAGVDGWYSLSPQAEGTCLETSMAISVELPFPGVTRPAVTTAMKGVVALMGQRFSHNLLEHLGARTT